MAGRGAWNTAGTGGTKRYKDANRPGPYYYLGSGLKPSGRERNSDEYAVYRAVVAIQKAVSKRTGRNVVADGVYGSETWSAIFAFQEANSEKTGTPWGGVGPDSAEALFLPGAEYQVSLTTDPKVTLAMVTGTVRTESLFDPGAVGYMDDQDLGLAQINGPSHPLLSRDERLTPGVAFGFVVDYYTNALSQLSENVRDSVASYNLGIGGARNWIKAGRPDLWKPTATSAERNVKAYIDKILAG